MGYTAAAKVCQASMHRTVGIAANWAAEMLQRGSEEPDKIYTQLADRGQRDLQKLQNTELDRS